MRVWERIRQNDPHFAVPSAEQILEEAGYGRGWREGLLGEASTEGAQDARDKVLTGGNTQATNLERLVGLLPAAQEEVLHSRTQVATRVNEAVQEIDDELAALSGEDSSDREKRTKIAKWKVDSIEAQIDDLTNVSHTSPVTIALALVAAVTGLIVDTFFLADAFLAAEFVETQSASWVLAAIAAIVMAAISITSGFTWALGRIPVGVSPVYMDETTRNHESQVMSNTRSRKRIFRFVSAVLAVCVIGVFLFLAGLRIAKWRAAASAEQVVDDSSLGLVVPDERGGAIWVVMAILLLALLSLIVFWWEGHNLGHSFSLRRERGALSDAENELEEFQALNSADKVMTKRKADLASGLQGLDQLTKEAIQILGNLFEPIVLAYKSAAEDACASSKDPEVRAQQPRFRGLSPRGYRSTENVTAFAQPDPVPSTVGAAPEPEQSSAADAVPDDADFDWGAGNDAR